MTIKELKNGDCFEFTNSRLKWIVLAQEKDFIIIQNKSKSIKRIISKTAIVLGERYGDKKVILIENESKNN